MSSESDFAYSLKYNTHFIVKNITGYTDEQILAETNLVVPKTIRSPKKVVSIFNYPINPGQTRDLLQIPGIQEADIRASLLKGVVRHKFLCGDIALVASNIDLLQFSDQQRQFLIDYGFTEGVQIGVTELRQDTINLIGSGGGGAASFSFLFKQNMPVSGVLNGTNRLFTLPHKFINGETGGNVFKIKVYHNGRLLVENIDYMVQESVPAMGYDTIFFISFAPVSSSIILVDYVVENTQTLTPQEVTVRDLITFITEGPAKGFASGAYKEILPVADPFPTTIIWWESAAKLKKIVEQSFTYNVDNLIIIEEWKAYAADGSIVSTISDAITYDGAIEISRLRTIS